MTKKIVFKGALALMIMIVASSAAFAQNDAQEYTKWNVGGTVGTHFYELPDSYGLYGAYFLNQKYGCGLVAFGSKDVDANLRPMKDIFLMPAFFANWGRSNSKLFYPTRIGLGVDRYTSYLRFGNKPFTEFLFAFYVSGGIAYRPAKFISFGVNTEIGVAFGGNACVNFNAGISFHF